MHRVRGLVEWIGPVEACTHVAGCDQLCQAFDVEVVLVRGLHGEPLADEWRACDRAELATHACQAACVFAADQDERSGRAESTAEPGEWRAAPDVEDHVVPLRISREVVFRVIDDVVGAECHYEVDLRAAAHPGDLRTKDLRNLYGEGPNTARGADDEHPLARLNAAHVAKALQGSDSGDWHHRGLLEGDVGRLPRELGLEDRRELRERAFADAEHVVADLEPRHRRASLHNRAGNVAPGNA